MDVLKLIEKEGLRRNLSKRTIKTYALTVQKFLRVVKKEPHQIRKQDIEEHLETLIKRNRSGNTVNVYLNALKFFYEQVLHKRLTINLRFAKTRKRLPVFLTQEELIRFFDSIQNKKHKLMMELLYSAGLRVSELVKLRVNNFELDNNYGWVRSGKGGKDRAFIVAKELRARLKEWIEVNNLNHNDRIFSGLNGKHYSSESVRQIIKKACKSSKIKKKVGPHTLRHSFATHLIENGYSITEVQPLLGHSRIDTTMVYTHLAAPKLFNVESPLDKLRLNIK